MPEYERGAIPNYGGDPEVAREMEAMREREEGPVPVPAEPMAEPQAEPVQPEPAPPAQPDSTP